MADQALAFQSAVTHRAQALLAGIGFIYFGYFLARVLGDLSGFFSREHAEELLVAPALTLALIPFPLRRCLGIPARSIVAVKIVAGHGR